MQMRCLIESTSLEGFNNTEALPPQSISSSVDPSVMMTNPNYKSWVDTDRLVREWIIGYLSIEVLGFIVGLPTSHEV